jgi:hypothetical protein
MLWLKQGRRFVKELREIADFAAGRAACSPTRDDRIELDDFVRNLGQIWVKYTGRQLTTAKKRPTPRDFIAAVLSALQIEATDRQIESSLQAAVRDLKQDYRQ